MALMCGLVAHAVAPLAVVGMLWAWIVSFAVFPRAIVGGLWTASGFIAFALVVSVWPVAVFWPLAAPPKLLWRDRSWLWPLSVTAGALACSPGGSLWPIAVPRSLSSFSWPLAITGAVASLLCPLAVWGERLASQAWVTGGCGDGCCPPASRCLWSVAAVTPVSVGSAASPFLPVVTWSGHSVG